MITLLVEPSEETTCPHLCFCERGKAVRIIRAIFHGLEVGLAERTVIRGIRAIVTFGDAQTNSRLRERLTAHRSIVIRVQVAACNIGYQDSTHEGINGKRPSTKLFKMEQQHCKVVGMRST